MNDPRTENPPPSPTPLTVPPPPLAPPPAPEAPLPAPGAAERFWLPDWSQSLRLLGWRWAFLLPPLAILGLIAAAFFLPFMWVLFYILLKLAFVAASVPVALFFKSVRTVVQNRREPFCIHCGYDLSGLPDGHRCPECGVPYRFAEIDEYRRDPHWFIQRHKARKDLPARDERFPAGPHRRPRSRDGT